MLEPPEVAFVTEFRFSSAVWAEGVRILDEALEAGAKLALASACCTFSVASVPPLNPPLKAVMTRMVSSSSPESSGSAAWRSSSTPRSDGTDSNPQQWITRAPVLLARS